MSVITTTAEQFQLTRHRQSDGRLDVSGFSDPHEEPRCQSLRGGAAARPCGSKRDRRLADRALSKLRQIPGMAPWTDTKTCHTAESATLPVLFQQEPQRRGVTPERSALVRAQASRLGFKPFAAFAPQRRPRPAPLPPVQRTRLSNGFAGDFKATQRLAEPILRPDYYKLEQFVPLLRTW